MPANSKSQQRFMGMVHAYKTGTLDTSKLPDELVQKIKKAAEGMTKKEVDDFASTKQKGLPEKKASMKKESNVLRAITTATGSLGGGVVGGAIQDKRYKDLAKKGVPISFDQHVTGVMKGMLLGGMAGAAIGSGVGTKIKNVQAVKATLKPLEDTQKMFSGLHRKQQMVATEIRKATKHFAKDFPEVKDYKMNKKLEYTNARILRDFNSPEGISAARIQTEIMDDFIDQTLRRIQRKTPIGQRGNRKRGFKIALKTRKMQDIDNTNIYTHLEGKRNAIFGFEKIGQISEEQVWEWMKKTATRYSDQLYEPVVQKIPLTKRVQTATIYAGAPSAILTAGFNYLGKARKPLKTGLVVGAIATGFSTVLMPKQRQVFLPVNDPEKN